MTARWGLAVAAFVLLVACSNSRDTKVTAARLSRPLTTVPPAAEPVATTATSTTASPTTTTTVVVRPTSTESGRAPSTVPSTTTLAAAAPAACQASAFQAAISFDKPSYRSGETVTTTAAFTNVSGVACTFASTQSSIKVVDATGAEMGPSPVLIGDYFTSVTVAPGETRSENMSWSQPAPAGTYTATVTVRPFGSASDSFVVS